MSARLVLVLLGVSGSAIAADPVADISRCAAVADRDARLACYDDLGSRYAAKKGAPAAAIPAQVAKAAAAPAPSAATATAAQPANRCRPTATSSIPVGAAGRQDLGPTRVARAVRPAAQPTAEGPRGAEKAHRHRGRGQRFRPRSQRSPGCSGRQRPVLGVVARLRSAAGPGRQGVDPTGAARLIHHDNPERSRASREASYSIASRGAINGS